MQNGIGHLALASTSAMGDGIDRPAPTPLYVPGRDNAVNREIERQRQLEEANQ